MLSDTYYHNIQQLPVMCEICCELFISETIVSANWARTASVSVSPISDYSDMGDRVYIIRPNTQIWTQWTKKFA